MLTIRKTSLLISVIYMVLLMAGLIISRAVWFYPNEVDTVVQLQQRESLSVAEFIEKQKQYIQATTQDYSRWDSVYQLTQGRGSPFVEKALNYETFSTLGIIAAVVTDLKGITLASASIDYGQGQFHNSAPEFSGWIAKHSAENRQALLSSGADFYSIDGQLYLLAMTEVTGSQVNNRANGYLLFAREADSAFWQEVRDITRVDFQEFYTAPTSCQLLDNEIIKPERSFTRCIQNRLTDKILAITFKSNGKQIPELIPMEIYFTFLFLAAIPTVLYLLFLQLVVEPMRQATQHMAMNNIISPLPSLNLVPWLKIKELEDLRFSYNQLIERIRTQQFELTRLSQTDKLTGIGNRRAFEDVFSQTWRRAMRHKDNVALILIDIDYFKRYNDFYGHQQGDVALQKVAKTLNQCAQRQDEYAFRYGGEEFIVICYAKDACELNAIREQLKVSIAALALPHPTSTVDKNLTVSAGMAWIIQSGSWLRDRNKSDWLRAADAALYEAKAAGRNCSMLQIISEEIAFTGTPGLGQSQQEP